MPYETILFEIREAVACITLNRPEKLNAFTARMHEELHAAVDEVRGNGALRALLITGSGRGFCAGQDLNERAMSGDPDGPDVGNALEKSYNPLVHGLRELGLPVICAVNGVAAGAGCNFALTADIVIAARSASFIEVFSRIGLIPDAGGTYALPRLVGAARAMAMSLLAEPVSGEQAASWGLIWKCVDDDKLMSEAHALAQRLAGGPTRAYGLIKQALNASPANTLEQQLALEAKLQRQAGKTADFREGVQAFLQKRTPVYQGC
ncbi:MAG TPA: 2-(1,2-epoxy-1,2-dihydrophenyl)acetyl-CoA isomerase PaaG [Burkholderiales bacterium]|nr:2-(1,2-epoxy-1,2-dihydrophenyl)acetyl-CoA isomerase PaaG [Burkholderiales bacterium]